MLYSIMDFLTMISHDESRTKGPTALLFVMGSMASESIVIIINVNRNFMLYTFHVSF
jgi:hypothetical protein